MNRWVFLAAWLLLAALKLALAVSLPLFGDEAFYWWEGRHPAWSYSDLPPLTAWLTAAGHALLPGEIGVRSIFLALGLLLPWQVVALTARWFGPDAAWRASLLALVLPLLAWLGVLALPDVPLAVLGLLALDRWLLAMRDMRLRDWLLLGLALALGLLCHYRFAAVPLVLAAVTLSQPTGRRALTTSGPWLAMAVAFVGLLPLLLFNLDHELAGLRFQLLDRHPWSWQNDGWLQLPEQAMVVSPVLFGLLVWLYARRRVGTAAWPETVLLRFALCLWLLFVLLGFFADNQRFRWHWPLPAYLALLPVLAASWPAVHRLLRTVAVAMAVVCSALATAYLSAAVWPEVAASWFDGKRFPANFSGWREAARWQAEAAGTEPLVVDNFMLAAALRFYLPTPTPLHVLDDPSNRHHGRAVQLAIWGVDEKALAVQPDGPGWLLVEESARRFSDRWAWYRALCRRFEGLRLDSDLLLFDGRKRFVRWHFDRYAPRSRCRQLAELPPLGWVQALPSRLQQGQTLVLFGWVAQPGLGIEQVEVTLDGRLVERLGRTVDIDWARSRWGELSDPAGDRLGFRGELDSSGWPAGRHRIAVIARRPDGLAWRLAESEIELVP